MQAGSTRFERILTHAARPGSRGKHSFSGYRDRPFPELKVGYFQCGSRSGYGVSGITKGLQEPAIDTKLVGSFRMGARAVDWARLESVCTARYRGFESLPIRQLIRPRTRRRPRPLMVTRVSNRLPGRVKEVHFIQLKIVAHRISVAEVVKSSQADGESIVGWR
jgi:hypothetical protein